MIWSSAFFSGLADNIPPTAGLAKVHAGFQSEILNPEYVGLLIIGTCPCGYLFSEPGLEGISHPSDVHLQWLPPAFLIKKATTSPPCNM